MRCLACETEKQPGSWVCPNCGTPIPEPPKPPYKAGGWEWAAALACFALFWLFQDEGHPEYRGGPAVAFLLLMLGLAPMVVWPALAFSAARDRTRRVGRAVGTLCLIFWILLTLDEFWPPLVLMAYMALILAFEHVLWRMKLARM